MQTKNWPVQNMHLRFTEMHVLNGYGFFSPQVSISEIFNPDFVFECSHNCLMHLKVALSIVLIVIMELSLNRSVKNLNLAALKDRGK